MAPVRPKHMIRPKRMIRPKHMIRPKRMIRPKHMMTLRPEDERIRSVYKRF
jgi:hypothetical protein